ncbi:hypothetical protein MNBD_GAMMA20-1961 [hydrothermal vent metagenome]|uniref:Uncharacterized protein n=1 Tax=hydrothermal vent metagenome TaxID=652676 RepID=A0A3B0ZH44_9ZZZZ
MASEFRPLCRGFYRTSQVALSPNVEYRHSGMFLAGIQRLQPLGIGLGFGVLRRPTAYIHVGLRRSDG